ncbi:MAG: hypothetical protein IKS48_06535 [Eubacterium sp.]|nr:hypothetical protein [Eubacterium sp.]
MKGLKNKTLKCFLFIVGFLGSVTAVIAGFAFIANYQIFDGDVKQDSIYLTSSNIKESVQDYAVDVLYRAKSTSTIKNLDFNKTLKIIDSDQIGKSLNNSKNEISLKKFMNLPKGSESIDDVLCTYVSREEKDFINSIPEVEDLCFVKLSWSEYEKLIKNNSFKFSWDEYDAVRGRAETKEDSKAGLTDDKIAGYMALNEAVNYSYISGDFCEDDYVVYYDNNVLLYSIKNGYIYQNNQIYHNGGVIYVNNDMKNTDVYFPYPDNVTDNNELEKSIITSHLLSTKNEVCVASLDSDTLSMIKNTNNQYEYYRTGYSSTYSFNGTVAYDPLINSVRFGQIPYLKQDRNSVSYKGIIERLGNVSDVFISYNAKTGNLEQWYLDETGNKKSFEYIDENYLEDLKSISNIDFVIGIDVKNTYNLMMESVFYDLCKVVPVPAILMILGLVAFITAVIILAISEPPVMRGFDKTPLIFLAGLLIVAFLFAGLFFLMVGDGWTAGVNYVIKDYFSFISLFLIIACIVYVLCAAVTLSIVRRIKCKKFWNGFIFYNFLKSIYDRFRSVINRMKGRTRLFISLILFLFVNIFSVLYIWSWSGSRRAGIFILLIVVMDLYIAYRASKYIVEIEEILEVTHAIENGELDSKIDISKLSYNNIEIGRSINNLGQGLAKAVESSVRDEKTKAELITNVSHDIKTPLTSIINYVDLLKRENIDNPKAIEYINVIDKKSDRLKQLILDLIEASKTSTGNIELDKINMNIVELMGQVVGEYEDKFSEKNLELVQNIAEDRVVINGDGRRIFRIIDNVMNNIYKYAQSGTRVYLDVYKLEKDGVEFVSIDFKNVSSQMLNISPEELMERFVRGDESRSTEGSGLGLSIAKNLTKLHDGNFDIEIDGDLFKVSVQFPVVSEINEINEQE